MKAKELRELQKAFKPKKLKQTSGKPGSSGLIQYEVVRLCGCCYQTLSYRSDAAAQLALTVYPKVKVPKDATGQPLVDDIDLFYGIWRKP